MPETERERNARLDNLMTRILIAEPTKRHRVIASEALHHNESIQKADLRTLLFDATLIIDKVIDRAGIRDEYDRYLLDRLVNGPGK